MLISDCSFRDPNQVGRSSLISEIVGDTDQNFAQTTTIAQPDSVNEKSRHQRMADSASESISQKSTEKIGQAFLMSSRDELFLYELYIMQDRLILIES